MTRRACFDVLTAASSRWNENEECLPSQPSFQACQFDVVKEKRQRYRAAQVN